MKHYQEKLGIIIIIALCICAMVLAEELIKLIN